MWKYINKLKGVDMKQKAVDIYKADGTVMEKGEMSVKMMDGWKGIYQMQEDDNEVCWGEDRRTCYLMDEYTDRSTIELTSREADDCQRFPEELLEHYEMVKGNIERRSEGYQILFDRQPYVSLRIPQDIAEHMDVLKIQYRGDEIKYRMEITKIEQQEIIQSLKKLKNGKQPGPDRMKAEIYRWMIDSEICLRTLGKCFNGVLYWGTPPEYWKKSRTIMIPKTKKPKVAEFRPIALTNVEYKIFMNIVKEKIVQRLSENNEINCMQMGFTRGRRLEDNLFMLVYCLRSAKKMRKQLVVTAIDFAKAFDSVNRRCLIETLAYYKCDPRIIDAVASLYTGDETEISVNGEVMGNMEVRNGIRQGCTGSPQFFLMVVNVIIKRIVETGFGFRNEEVYVPALFYADDGMLIATSVGEMEKMIEVLVEVAARSGLRINIDKCKTMIFQRENLRN